MRSRLLGCVWLALAMVLNSCVTWDGGSQADKPPAITAKTPLAELLQAGIDFGDKTLQEAKKQLKVRQGATEAEPILYELIADNYQSWPAPKVINALHIYQLTTATRAPALFKLLVRADRNFLHQVAWHLASVVPSAPMASEVEAKLTEAISEGAWEDLFWPKMAEAVASNKLVQSYTVVRQGLFASHHVAFARAMIQLNPPRASYDFMDYLALTPVEELRQLTLTSVDVYSCMEILEHFRNYPVVASHPKFEHLFFYTISRNTVLADMSRKVLESYLPRRNTHMAFLLARLPTWVQVAFVEGTRRQMTPLLNVFLSELKTTTSQREVIEEIDNIVR